MEGKVARRGFWGWFLHRVTAVLLLFFLGAHFFYFHYALDWPITLQDIRGSLFLRVVDIAILVLLLYHGLYGIRTTLLNFGIGARAERVLNPVLALIGVAVFIFGLQVFWAIL
jgi:succinate dehydrogenase/fumarate reductase cytochrome b subunit